MDAWRKHSVFQAVAPDTASWLNTHGEAYGLVTALGQQSAVDPGTLSAARRALG